MTLRTSDAQRRRMRAYLVARDGRACGRCGDPIELETPSLGHIVALAHGGTDDAVNLRLEHVRCNREAGADGDRARIVRPSEAGFSPGTRLPGSTRRVSNGARSRPMRRSIAIYRLAPEDGARPPRIDEEPR